MGTILFRGGGVSVQRTKIENLLLNNDVESIFKIVQEFGLIHNLDPSALLE